MEDNSQQQQNNQNAQDVVIPSLDLLSNMEDNPSQGTIVDNGLGQGQDNNQNQNQNQGQGTDNGQGQGQGNQNQQGSATPPVADELLAVLTNSSLSAEDTVFRNTLLDRFGATGVDSKGNLLNANNEIVLSYANLNNFIDTGNVLTDEQGNQVNELGQIVKTKEDITNDIGLSDVLKNHITENYGFSFVDENNTPVNYPNTEEGHLALLEDTIAKTSNAAVSNFLSTNPLLKDMYYHLQAGKPLEEFTTTVQDYTAVDVDTLSKEQKLAYIRQSYEKQGVKNFASILKLIENAGDEQLNQSTSDALLTLNTLTEEQRTANEEAVRKQRAEEEKEVQKYWANVADVIKKGRLRNLTIPEQEKLNFYKYIAEPIDKEGNTRESVDASNEDTEFQLLVSYLRYNKYDFDKFIKTQAKADRLAALRQRVIVPNPKIDVARQRTDNNQSHATNIPPSIERLLG